MPWSTVGQLGRPAAGALIITNQYDGLIIFQTLHVATVLYVSNVHQNDLTGHLGLHRFCKPWLRGPSFRGKRNKHVYMYIYIYRSCIEESNGLTYQLTCMNVFLLYIYMFRYAHVYVYKICTQRPQGRGPATCAMFHGPSLISDDVFRGFPVGPRYSMI